MKQLNLLSCFDDVQNQPERVFIDSCVCDNTENLKTICKGERTRVKFV